MITVGIICLVVAALFWGNPILWTIGVILVVLGAIFWILGAMGRAVGGRRPLLLGRAALVLLCSRVSGFAVPTPMAAPADGLEEAGIVAFRPRLRRGA